MQHLPFALRVFLPLATVLTWPVGTAYAEDASEIRRRFDMAVQHGDGDEAARQGNALVAALSRHGRSSWALFDAQLALCRGGLQLKRLALAEAGCTGAWAQAEATTRRPGAMERAIAGIALAALRLEQRRHAEATELARLALETLQAARQQQRISANTYAAELPVYEAVLAAARAELPVAPPGVVVRSYEPKEPRVLPPESRR